jgi:predicted Zn-dependent peptidase
MKPVVTTLSNGLKTILIDTKAFPSMTAILLFRAGSRYENKKNNGIAHFFEHMPFKGSRRYPSFFEISSVLEGLGAVHNAYTSKDHTAYWIKAPTEDFSVVINVLSDMILHPLLKSDEIEREKGVIVEEINMYEDSPQRKVGDLFENLLYGKTPLGMDTTGTKETVTKFTRKTFTDYMSSLYHPENAVFVVAGGLQGQISNLKSQSQISNLKTFLDPIQEKFGGWNSKGTASFEKVKENQKKPETLIRYKKTEQTHYSLGFRTFPFDDPRRHALSVLTTVLGGGSSTRLFIEVRERRGLCYYISSGRELYQDVGYMTTQAGVTNNLEKIKESISVILGEHRKITQGKLHKGEVSRAKEIIKGRFLLSMEDSSNVASWHGTKYILEGKVEQVEDVIHEIEKVTEDEVVELAKEIFRPERLNLALIGPYEKKDLEGVLS